MKLGVCIPYRDSGDGVPNVLSDDDTFVSDDKRQRPLTQKKINLWLENLDDLQSVMKEIEYRNYQRNKKVIDLDEIPDEVTERILDKYNNYRNYIHYIILFLIVAGFIHYYFRQKNKFKDKFSLFRFIFDINCKKTKIDF